MYDNFDMPTPHNGARLCAARPWSPLLQSRFMSLYVSFYTQLQDQKGNHRILEGVPKRNVNICVFF